MVLPFLAALTLLHPRLQQLDNGLFHPLRGIALGEILAELVRGERHLVRLRPLFLRHDGARVPPGSAPSPGWLSSAAGPGTRRGRSANTPSRPAPAPARPAELRRILQRS